MNRKIREIPNIQLTLPSVMRKNNNDNYDLSRNAHNLCSVNYNKSILLGVKIRCSCDKITVWEFHFKILFTLTGMRAHGRIQRMKITMKIGKKNSPCHIEISKFCLLGWCNDVVRTSTMRNCPLINQFWGCIFTRRLWNFAIAILWCGETWLALVFLQKLNACDPITSVAPP